MALFGLPTTTKPPEGFRAEVASQVGRITQETSPLKTQKAPGEVEKRGRFGRSERDPSPWGGSLSLSLKTTRKTVLTWVEPHDPKDSLPQETPRLDPGAPGSRCFHFSARDLVCWATANVSRENTGSYLLRVIPSIGVGPWPVVDFLSTSCRQTI